MDTSLFYTDQGSGDAIVLLHGMVGSHRYWYKIVPELTKHYRVIAFDLLGFGKSPKPNDTKYTLDDHIVAVMTQINGLNLRKFTLVGHSMGSIIALGIASSYPDRVTKLILTSMPIYKTPEVAMRKITRSKMAPKLMLYGSTAWIMCRLACYTRPIMKKIVPLILKDLPRNIAIDSLDHNWTSYSRSMLHVIQEQHVITQLKNITIPITILIGSRDRLMDEYQPKDLEKLSRFISVKVLETTHHLPLEAPDTIIQSIKE